MEQLEKIGERSYPIFLIHFVFAWYVLADICGDTVLFFSLVIPCFFLTIQTGTMVAVLQERLQSAGSHRHRKNETESHEPVNK